MKGIGPTGFENFVPAPHLYTFDLNKAKALLKKVYDLALCVLIGLPLGILSALFKDRWRG